MPSKKRQQESAKKCCIGGALNNPFGVPGAAKIAAFLKYGSGWPTIWAVAAEREDAGRFIVHADKMLIAFVELQPAIHRQFERG